MMLIVLGKGRNWEKVLEKILYLAKDLQVKTKVILYLSQQLRRPLTFCGAAVSGNYEGHLGK